MWRERRRAAVAAGAVVLRGAVAAHHVDALGAHAHRVELLQHQLELVDQPRVQRDVLGPDVELVLGEELPQAEVLGDAGGPGSRGVTSMKPVGRRVRSVRPVALGGVGADVVAVEIAGVLAEKGTSVTIDRKSAAGAGSSFQTPGLAGAARVPPDIGSPSRSERVPSCGVQCTRSLAGCSAWRRKGRSSASRVRTMATRSAPLRPASAAAAAGGADPDGAAAREEDDGRDWACAGACRSPSATGAAARTERSLMCGTASGEGNGNSRARGPNYGWSSRRSSTG